MNQELLGLVSQLLESQTKEKQATRGLLEDALDSILRMENVSDGEVKRAVTAAKKRREMLKTCDTVFGQEIQKKKCAFSLEGMLYWFDNFAFTADPRPTAPIFTNCFVPYDFQVDALQWLWKITYEKHEDCLMDKSRDMGVSWLMCGFSIYCWLFSSKDAPFSSLIGSRKEDYVDKRGDMSTLFEKLRFMLSRLPYWMLPEGFSPKEHLTWMTIINPVTGSTIRGESSNDQFGRGGRYTQIVFDEFAYFPAGGNAAWTAASESTRTRVAVSTPQGKNNKFAELRHTPGMNVKSFHWTQHPFKNEAWYESQAKRMSSAERAQELDLDYEGSLAGRLFPMYSELHHVITWTEFAAAIGDDAISRNRETGEFRYRIPIHWALGMAMDVGTTIQHPNITTWCAVAAQDSALAGSVFLYRQHLIAEHAHPGMVGPLLKGLMAQDNELDRMQLMVMSHEANSERLAYNLEHELPFDSWDTRMGYNQGIAQMQDYLAIKGDQPHPFRSKLMGRPRLYIIVDDSQGQLIQGEMGISVSSAVDDAGFIRLRKEIPMYHIPQSEAGKPVKQQRPYKLFDDAIDTVRALAAQLWPEAVELSIEQKLDKKMPEHFQLSNLKETLVTGGAGAVHAYLDVQRQVKAELDEVESFAYYSIDTKEQQHEWI